jgi:putative tryptophan/tyrosine transport system permease protein
MNVILNIFEQGLIFSIVAIGVYLTYRILDFPDLSVDGTFPLGASVTAFCLVHGINPFIACLLSLLAGFAGGILTGLLHVKFKISNLLSGILVMIAMYSINLRIMSKSNVPLFNLNTVFSGNINPIYIIIFFAFVAKLTLDLFLKTKLGFALRAVGDNEQLVTSLGVNKNSIKVVGLMLSNGFTALAGSLMAQNQGFSDINMGTGIVVMGLASVIMGESLLRNIKFIKLTTMAVVGSLLYKAAVALALELGLAPTDLKLITAVIVVIALSLNNNKLGYTIKRKLGLRGDTFANNTRSS